MIEQLTTKIEAAMDELGFVGLSIALVDDQKVIWAQGFGFADLEEGVNATGDTVYGFGSISKPLVATAAMQMAEEGLLDLDRPYQAYVPDFSIRSRFPEGDPITARSLLTHHAGIFSDYMAGEYAANPESMADFVRELKSEFVSFPPNYKYMYSNIGYVMLGNQMAVVDGEIFSDLMERRLFDPLGMTRSSYLLDPRVQAHLSKPYWRGTEEEQFLERDLPAGGLYSTVTDLSCFMRMVFAGGTFEGQVILAPDTLMEMLTPQNRGLEFDLGQPQGIGWDLTTWPGVGPEGTRMAGHGGGTPNHISRLLMLPEYKLGVVAVVNSPEGGPFLDELVPAALSMLLQAKTGESADQESSMPMAGEPVTLSAEVLHDYEGTYATQWGIVDVSATGEGLSARVRGQTIQLRPQSGDIFEPRLQLLGFIPLKLGELKDQLVGFERMGGLDVVIVHHLGQKIAFGTRIEPHAIPPAWLDRLGDYENRAPQGQSAYDFPWVNLRIEEGILVLHVTGVNVTRGNEKWGYDTFLKPINDTEAVIWMPEDGRTVEYVPDMEAGVLRFNGYEFHRVP